MDKLLALKMFVETVDAKGFSAAARKLGIATSSVTRMIDSLEAQLGTVLFNRSTRQVTVSDAGAAYYRRARKILDDVADAGVAALRTTENLDAANLARTRVVGDVEDGLYLDHTMVAFSTMAWRAHRF